MTPISPPGQHHSLVPAVGFGYFPLALAARLPFAMMVVGILTLVVAARDSLTLGGLTSAGAGIAGAIVGPLIGAAVDRYGQRPVLLLAGVANSLALVAMSLVVFSPAPDWAVLAVAAVAGGTAPQAGPMSRSRLVGVIGRDIVPVRRTRVFHTTMAYESAADESVFAFGPVIVGVLATTVHPVAPVVGAAVLTAIFLIGFALHRTASVVPAGESDHPAGTTGRRPVQAPARELVRARILVVVAGVLGVGVTFGTVLTSLTAYMDDLGHSERAGLVYGALGLGSAVLALAVGRLPTRFSLRARLLVFSCLMLSGVVVFSLGGPLPLVVVSMVMIGIGIGPILVTQFSLGALRSPQGRSATVMTMLGSAVMVGQSTASAVTGWLADTAGTQVALAAPLAAAVIILSAAVVNWRLSGSTADPQPGA